MRLRRSYVINDVANDASFKEFELFFQEIRPWIQKDML